MDSLPTFNRDGESVIDKAKSGARNLLPWLPDPYSCPDCNALCEASRTYDPRTAAFHPGGLAPSWECPECGSAFRREEPWMD